MHAYLLITKSTNDKSQINDLADKFKAKIMEYPLAKIEDVRNLNNFLRLTITEPTLIVCNNIHEAGIEALNAFYKNSKHEYRNPKF